MDASPNRRRFPRIPTTNAVLVELLGDAVGEDLARTRNLSVSGCLFTSSRGFPTGAVIQMLIKIKDVVVEPVARVVYVIPRDGGSYDVGAEFLVIRDDDRDALADFFNNLSGQQ
jgi:hypothetical protein